MKTINEIYEPFNFSATSCYVIVYEIGMEEIIKIENKLPNFIKQLKGIFVSVSIDNSIGKAFNKTAGFISLNFNGQSLKCFHSPVHRRFGLKECPHPFPLDEQIHPNSFMQGYFLPPISGANTSPYTVSIYLHYLP
jgi:hypothetical protein